MITVVGLPEMGEVGETGECNCSSQICSEAARWVLGIERIHEIPTSYTIASVEELDDNRDLLNTLTRDPRRVVASFDFTKKSSPSRPNSKASSVAAGGSASNSIAAPESFASVSINPSASFEQSVSSKSVESSSSSSPSFPSSARLPSSSESFSGSISVASAFEDTKDADELLLHDRSPQTFNSLISSISSSRYIYLNLFELFN